ncbi:ABC transporter substrate-binding protein [Roseinatronobacter alkalisoli]|uniref:ABC transporter substrate-binding protein n=1 Tax=Roseinatronobacter alkalisoli TaxID=3028235 RepID=A0ABT5TCB5_9RHOB|nr:ABC transporter substrate-binding protein [Roseinatronobacter sp. HJB301]MDD7972761.1 ABC transporter substrate-binding protein [Roseinatronobacter sp. HJB301]
MKLTRIAGVSLAVLLGTTVLTSAQTITVAMSPPSVETNRYWNTPGDFNLGPAMQGLVGHDPVTGMYDNSGLAESWSHNDDFTEWTFTLHEGAEFHFGYGPVTAADVVHSHTLHTGEDSTLIGVAQLKDVAVEALDERTVKFTLPRPQIDFLFAHGGRGSLVIYSKAQYDAEGLEGYDTRPAGTGEFQFVARNIGQGLTFERVENHWSGRDAEVERLVLRFIGEPATALATLLSREADMAVLPRELQPDAINAGFEAIGSSNAANQTAMLFNGTFLTEGDDKLDPTLPWLDIRIREAINRAIDREAVIDVLYDGRASILPVFGMDPRHEGYREDLAEMFEEYYGYDPERAMALMAEAGYPQDFENPVIPILSSNLAGNPEFPTMAELMQVFLDEVGFQTEIVELDWAGLGALRRAREARLFHPMRNMPVKPSAVGIGNYYASSGRPNVNYEDPVIEELNTLYAASTDPQEREELAGRIFQQAFEQYAVAPLASLSAEIMVNPETVAGWTFPGVTSAGISHFNLIEPQ